MPERTLELLYDAVMDLIKALQDIRHGMAELKQDIAELKQDMSLLKQDVAVLKRDVAVLRADVAALKYDMAEMKAFRQEATVHLGRFESGLETLRKDMNQFRNRMSDVERDIDSLKSR